MKLVKFVAVLGIDADVVSEGTVARALYVGEKHQEHYFDVVSIEEVQEEED